MEEQIGLYLIKYDKLENIYSILLYLILYFIFFLLRIILLYTRLYNILNWCYIAV